MCAPREYQVEENLIESVREFPCLWQTNSKPWLNPFTPFRRQCSTAVLAIDKFQIIIIYGNTQDCDGAS